MTQRQKPGCSFERNILSPGPLMEGATGKLGPASQEKLGLVRHGKW